MGIARSPGTKSTEPGRKWDCFRRSTPRRCSARCARKWIRTAPTSSASRCQINPFFLLPSTLCTESALIPQRQPTPLGARSTPFPCFPVLFAPKML
eukprot:424391-Rhodomonas_salina.1